MGYSDVLLGDPGRVDNPSFGPILEWFGEIFSVMVKGVVWSSDDNTLGDLLAVKDKTATQDLARKSVWDRRRETHCFIDAGIEIDAKIQNWARMNLLKLGEVTAYFLDDFLIRMWVVR